MKTQLFILLLQHAAKHSLPETEYAQLQTRIMYWRWQTLRQNFPEAWDRFSERYEAVRDQFESGASLSDTQALVVPEGLERHPELFRPFEEEIARARHDLDLEGTAPAAPDVVDTAPVADTAPVDLPTDEIPGSSSEGCVEGLILLPFRALAALWEAIDDAIDEGIGDAWAW